MKLKPWFVVCRPSTLSKCPPLPKNSAESALTRVDMVCALGVVLLLLSIALPLMANTKARSEQVSCWNNLRQIGKATRSWASDHENKNPWWIPFNEGGTWRPVKSGSAWWEFAWMNGDLGSPKVLHCPSDANKFVAPSWAEFTNSLRNDALSYFVGLHAVWEEPYSLLSGDRDLSMDGWSGACSSGVNNAWALIPIRSHSWQNQVHFQSGNLLYNNGVVQQVSNKELDTALRASTTTDDGTLHLLLPQ